MSHLHPETQLWAPPPLLGRNERRVGRVHRDYVPAHWEERNWDHLEIGQAERDTNDGDAENGTEYGVSDRKPDSLENEPEHVADAGGNSGAWLLDHRSPKWPKGEEANPEGGDAERDPDDGDAPKQSRDHVCKEHPEAGDDEPEDVE